MASQATAGFQLKRLRGLLEKKGSDGTWRTQYFTAHKSKLYYVDPGADPASAPPRAAMDLLEGLQKIERRGEKLVLWVDAKRRHQLRAVANPRKQDGPQPSLDDWELSLRERRLVAKARRDEKARSPRRRSSAETPPTPQRRQPPARQFSEAPPSRRPSAEPSRSPPPAERKPTPAEQASWDAFVARQAAETPPYQSPRTTPLAARREVAVMSAPPPPMEAAPAHHHHHSQSPRPRVGAGAPLQALVRASSPPRSRDESALDEFLASDVELLSTPQLERGLRAAGCRAIPPDDLSLRQRARELQASLLGQPPPPAVTPRYAEPPPPTPPLSRYSSPAISNSSFQYGTPRGSSARVDVARSAYDVDDDDVDDDRAARAKIIAFYREHNPSKVQDVDALIAKYRDVGVGASELLIAVQKKYARDQPQRRANQFSV
ncbi:unnamed protein product [Pelagomonas calceolata]|uniref:PH domain-containing protein n=1 Tax=Pelagomonas calceolata TaxID=35677 RepID=A0A7S3ZZD0_9STRA|nr:unnamed protein product [Pelagomonas calceolata]